MNPRLKGHLDKVLRPRGWFPILVSTLLSSGFDLPNAVSTGFHRLVDGDVVMLQEGVGALACILFTLPHNLDMVQLYLYLSHPAH